MEQKEKKAQGKNLEWVLLFLMIGVLAFVIRGVKGQQNDHLAQEIVSLTDGWYYLKGEEKISVTLPAEIEVDEEVLTLYHDELGQEAEGKTITTRGASYEMTIAVEEQKLYEYSDAAFPRNDQMKAKLDCCAILPTQLEGKTLEMTFYGEASQSFQIPEVYMGTGNAVTNFHYKNAAMTLILVLVMAFLALVAFGVAIYLRIVKMKDCRFANISCFLLICGIWCATDSSIIQHMTGLSPITCVISFYAFMMLAVPLVHFLRNTIALKKYRIWDWLQAAFYVNAIAQGLLNYFGVFEFIEMLFVVHLLLVASVVIAAWILIKEYLADGAQEIKVILGAFVMLSAGGLLSMVLYWLLEIPYYEMIFECGILIFVLLLLAGIVISMTDNVRFKTEMLVFQRLAKEDRLTGLKNRMAFEEYLTELQTKAAAFENVALIFLDLNQLKLVNDCHGHNAGDELLIASARCIQNTFGAEGNCFRIGGDEFCAIIENPMKTEQEWYDILDNEIQTYNKKSRFHMSIARGLSYLKDENGMIKTMSNWKYEADVKMYENKGRMKRV